MYGGEFPSIVGYVFSSNSLQAFFTSSSINFFSSLKTTKDIGENVWIVRSSISFHVMFSTKASIFLLYVHISSLYALSLGMYCSQTTFLIWCYQVFCSFIMETQKVVDLPWKSCSIVPILCMCWPWIIFKRLSQFVQKISNKHPYCNHINLVVLQAIS